ncbi:glycosyl transferase family 90 [Pseudohoeflea coraliihabitans]|uniref:Glycosyl transferase CAP10 domain-containing protein n=1 Tax=Pseudohoeflea coraliihabitans TaxID=2860393 RepID=A0ABS6WQ50_9HYPH|nr:glycosyl transferase family 90 [Pseudohoeflea sp. DP4N28-3]MBW3098087.1 hypothetical protein [Pseudohoeflea sp. DP4N28-3]
MTDFADQFRTLALGLKIRRRVWRRLRSYPGGAPSLRIRYSRQSPFPLILDMRRKGHRLELDFRSRFPDTHVPAMIHRTTAMVRLMTLCPEDIDRIHVDLSDGNDVYAAPLGFSTARPDVGLLPDPYFLETDNFAHLRAVADAATHPWRDRRQTLRWRGTDTSAGRCAFGLEHAADPTVKPRIRMCTIAATLPDTDCLFAATEKQHMRSVYRYHGLLGTPIPEADWINDRFAIDIDGHTNTWSNMIARMHLGCCVLKVESQFGYRQWYYDRLKSGIHYVPVRADMADLGEKLAWARAHPAEAEEIARNGQQLVRSMTLESEAQVAAETIRRFSA